MEPSDSKTETRGTEDTDYEKAVKIEPMEPTLETKPSDREDSEAMCSIKNEAELKQYAETKIAENGDERVGAEEEASDEDEEEERVVEETHLPESLLYKEPAYAGRLYTRV